MVVVVVCCLVLSGTPAAVFLWRHCNMLCTSSFMDEVMVANNGRE